MPDLDRTAETPTAGCVVLLIDESEGQNARIAGGTKSKSEVIATTVNSLLAQLAFGPPVDVAIAGYRAEGEESADVGCRWGGALTGRRFVRTTELAAAPVVVENRTRRVPGPTGFQEQTVPFPVWYMPQLGGQVTPLIGYGYCQHLISARVATPQPVALPPLVISFCGDWLHPKHKGAIRRVGKLQCPGGAPILLHAHLGETTVSPPVLYPSTDAFLPPGGAYELFHWSSKLPAVLANALVETGIVLNPGARGFIFNATMTDVIRLLGLVKTYAECVGAVSPQNPAIVSEDNEDLAGETESEEAAL